MDDDERILQPDPGADRAGDPACDRAVDRALGAWTPLAPPADFAERVLAARDAPAPPRRRRARLFAGIAAAIAVAVVAVAVLRPSRRAAGGALVTTQRVTEALGDRGLAVAEPATALVWRVDDGGAADIIQRTGNVFYRVERGGPFVVHTPAGDVHVTGTCFRIEVLPMNTNHKLLLAGVTGAAIASTVLVTVYEGHVIAETRSARTELPAGSRTTLDATVTASTIASPSDGELDEVHATREQLVARARAQHAQLVALRARLTELETATVASGVHEPAPAEPGRLWRDPSPERLAAWAAECHIRFDAPDLERFTPLTAPETTRGIEAGELDGYNAALTEMARQWKDLVRSLYLEATGDTAGVDTLSVEAMTHEIADKSPPGDHGMILQRLAQERAGLVPPPADLARASPYERLVRAQVLLGDQSEAALGKRIGAARAHAIRGDAWGSRSDLSGCPKQAAPE